MFFVERTGYWDPSDDVTIWGTEDGRPTTGSFLIVLLPVSLVRRNSIELSVSRETPPCPWFHVDRYVHTQCTPVSGFHSGRDVRPHTVLQLCHEQRSPERGLGGSLFMWFQIERLYDFNLN